MPAECRASDGRQLPAAGLHRNRRHSEPPPELGRGFVVSLGGGTTAGAGGLRLVTIPLMHRRRLALSRTGTQSTGRAVSGE